MRPELKAVPTEILDPPYPANTTAGSFALDIEVHRLLNSDTHAVLPPEVRPWWAYMFIVAWAQTPCGSLPSDIRVLAAKLGCSVQFLEGYRDDLLRHWERRSDGRLYHPILIDKVDSFLKYRDNEREKKRQQRQALKAKREEQKPDAAAANVRGVSPGTPEGLTEDSPGSPFYSSSSSSSSTSPSSREEEDIGLAKANPRRAEPDTASQSKADVTRYSADVTRDKRPTVSDATRVLDHLNAKTGRTFQAKLATGKPSKSVELIRLRLAEHGEAALIGVIDLKVGQWSSDAKMSAYLRPETLFGATKCEQYVGELSRPGVTGPSLQERLKARWAAQAGAGDFIDGECTRE
jgi:uncharacterized phage protein (TIGR02220 family)